MILITGNLGFIGSHLTKRLDNWIGFDLKDGQDIRNKYQLAKLFATHSIDTVIHLAAEAGVRRGEKYPDEYITTNIIGTRNLLELAEENNVKQFIFFSSSSVYGEQKPPFSEDMNVKPNCLYGITKATGELLCNISPVNTTIVRPFSVYGENGRGDQFLYKWINQIKSNKPISFYGEGNSKRGYVYAGDLANGVIKLLKKKQKSNFEVYNLGGQQIITLNVLSSIYKKAYEDLKIEKYPLPHADVLENWADISKAKKELSWSPDTNFEDKIIEIINKELYD